MSNLILIQIPESVLRHVQAANQAADGSVVRAIWAEKAERNRVKESEKLTDLPNRTCLGPVFYWIGGLFFEGLQTRSASDSVLAMRVLS